MENMENRKRIMKREEAIEAAAKKVVDDFIRCHSSYKRGISKLDALRFGVRAGYLAAESRTCKWTWNRDWGDFVTECGQTGGIWAKASPVIPEPDSDYCPSCGGKVEEVKDEPTLPAERSE